ncbi:hypothetical protein [Natrialba sp. SSL1]|uniref:hypothetical protein n=1 Tax=Natrialba sp. SSL1 TaxID=1869245 RepID=UPI0008F827A4|nr:hypothetical protein [Natrialba sp. SSL1]OIB55738.1 hypothetical protein BBD46_02990 [Natrialba sp. SSL1]
MEDDNSRGHENSADVPDFGMSALLTKNQRKYLNGKSDIEKKSAQERAVRARIRNRLYQSIVDLGLLHQHLEHRDLAKAVEDPNGVPISASIHDNIDAALALLLDGAIENRGGNIKYVGQTEETLEKILEKALTTMYLSHGQSVEQVNVDLNVNIGESLDEIAEKELEQLQPEELRQLAITGHIPFEKYEEILVNR